MLLVIVGQDRIKALSELEQRLSGLGKSAKVHLHADTFTRESARAVLEQENLFGGERPALVLDQTLSLPEAKEFLEEEASLLAKADGPVFVVEESLPVSARKLLEKAGAEIIVLEKKEEERAPSVFSLGDALGRRDKKNLWVLYQKFSKSAEPEELAGILFWQLKVLKLVALGEVSALNPYVLSKARGFLKNYSPEEVDRMLFSLLDLYHKAHRGEGELSSGLERFVLSV